MEPVTIHDGNAHEFFAPPPGQSKGLVPRDFTTHPQGCFANAAAFPEDLIIPESKWAGLIAEALAQKATLGDLREIANYGSRMPVKNQGQKGYCWAHSTTRAVEYARAIQGLPYFPLAAYAVACIIKGYRNEGGNCTDSLDFAVERGIPTEEFWPSQSMSRSNDNAATWANAAQNKVVEWYDFPEDGDKARAVLHTCMILRWPCAIDENWWSHSICAVRAMAVDEIEIDNSWGPDGFGVLGSGILQGRKAIPNGALACRVVNASQA